jgi:hypothetical protein
MENIMWYFSPESCAAKKRKSAQGEKQIQTLTKAKRNNYIAHIVGTGTCKRWVDAEDINYLSVFY